MKKQLKISQEPLINAAFDSNVDAMRITDSRGIIINVNKAYCNLTGIDKDALIGKPFITVYDKKEQADF